jgi:16S rRNA pseudouridine516 synthase
MERIDKILARELNITRSQAKDLVRSQKVFVDNVLVKKSDEKIGDNQSLVVDGKALSNNTFVYIMMNKPKGVISASDGKNEKTVVDILPDDMKRKNLFPAGRLDKDTTGFVLITDDGEFAHDILSPKKHIDKTYIATLDKPFDDNVADDFKNGMVLNGEKLLHAEIEAVNGDRTKAKVVLKQGLYHQVKRMFKKHGITVVELQRIAMGNLPLDDNLKLGECRYLDKKELELIKNSSKM